MAEKTASTRCRLKVELAAMEEARRDIYNQMVKKHDDSTARARSSPAART